MNNKIINDFVEIKLAEPDDFLKIKETLTRIGIPCFRNNILYQTCHIFHKKGRYYIAHYKEMKLLDEEENVHIKEDDIKRRNATVKRLLNWNLCSLADQSQEEFFGSDIPYVKMKVLKHAEKEDWTLVPRYQIGVI